MKRPRKDHYETLGVSKDASADEIKKARKKKAAAAHPDLGGDHETMAAINHAADVLMDPERRRLYDATGEDEKRVPLDEEARQFVLFNFQQALEAGAPSVLAKARQLINEDRERAAKAQKEFEAKRAQLEARRGKVQTEAGENLFEMLLDQHLRGIGNGIRSCEHRQELCNAALAILDSYTTSESEPTVEEQIYTMYIGRNPFRVR